ncbi:alpha/beta fold hydrolase [Streptomyces sp. NPDC058463]|uniref:alpha/beta fold hydrolase n=1 Tax=Streptomyces sp. NPDC058463 TaxID=3346510 RepID=UPI0036568042
MEDRSVVDVREVRLAYRTWGDPFGSPVVLLHGLGGSAASWEPVARLLGEEWRVYALDMRGHGESDWPDAYALEEMRDDVLGFLNECDLDRVGVVGHSMGGVVAYLLAEEYADRVERLVLVETPPPFPGQALDDRPTGPVDCDENALPAVRAQIAAPDPQWEEELGQIVAPTLMIAGGPESGMPQERLPDMASLIPDCRLITLGGGHQVHQRRAHEVAQQITEFFTS